MRCKGKKVQIKLVQLVHVHKAKLNTIYKFFLRERKESENGEMHFLHNWEKTPVN